tara:strand:- start:14 stop:439 length:426 start_codon:yes stop_codon:yes gene_type:complete
MRISLIAMLTMLTGCSRTGFYAPLGATVGGAVGSVGGPVASGGGALLGWSVGKGAALVEENKDLVQTVDALSRGDVSAIVSAQMKGQQSTIEKATDTIWTALKVAALCILGVLSIPLFITRSNSKKIKKICDKNDKATGNI